MTCAVVCWILYQLTYIIYYISFASLKYTCKFTSEDSTAHWIIATSLPKIQVLTKFVIHRNDFISSFISILIWLFELFVHFRLVTWNIWILHYKLWHKLNTKQSPNLFRFVILVNMLNCKSYHFIQNAFRLLLVFLEYSFKKLIT